MRSSSVFASQGASLLSVCAGLFATGVTGIAFAQALAPPSLAPVTAAFINNAPLSHPSYSPPEHLEVGNQVFDGSVGGFRTYLDSRRLADPQLFAALDPKVRDLESRVNTALTVFTAGAVVGVVSTVYAFAGQDACYEPAVTDPNFAAKSQAWGDCNSRNGTHFVIFTAAGVGVVALGGIAAYLLAPHRADILDLLNEHNRLSPDPIRLQLGYDPAHRLTLGGVSTTF